MTLKNFSLSTRSGWFGSLPQVIRWILIVNVSIYALDLLFLDHAIRDRFAFRISSAIHGFAIWEFVTFQFLHGSLGHLFFNSVGLFFFGPFMERYWGSKRFIWFYLISGAGGAGFYTCLTYLNILPNFQSLALGQEPIIDYSSASIPLVGASAGIYGILVGVAMVAPSLKVSLLFPPITLTMRQFAIALLVIALGVILLDIGNNQGGEAGHLGGAILGFLLMKWGQAGNSWSVRKFIRKKQASKYTAKLRPRTSIDFQQQSEADTILDKISREGFQSLNERERNILQEAARRANSSNL